MVDKKVVEVTMMALGYNNQLIMLLLLGRWPSFAVAVRRRKN
jgi:hypothetical protein